MKRKSFLDSAPTKNFDLAKEYIQVGVYVGLRTIYRRSDLRKYAHTTLPKHTQTYDNWSSRHCNSWENDELRVFNEPLWGRTFHVFGNVVCLPRLCLVLERPQT